MSKLQTFDPNSPPLVEETLLKKRRDLDELARIRSINLKKQVSRKRVIRGEDVRIKRPEQFVKEYRINEGSNNKMKRRKREVERKVNPGVQPSDMLKTVGIAVRIHEGRHSSIEIKNELKKFGLSKKYDAVFLRLDEVGIRNLKPLDAYVAYGYISYKFAHELIHRRAYTNLGGTKKPLKDNLIIEKVLGDKNILCLTDLLDEIYNLGPNFESALNILTTFRLASPVGNYEKKILNVHDEIESKGGFLGTKINQFLGKII